MASGRCSYTLVDNLSKLFKAQRYQPSRKRVSQPVGIEPSIVELIVPGNVKIMNLV